MKKINNFASPFIMLLIPLFLLIGIITMNVRNVVQVSKQNTELKIQAPSIKDVFKASFK